MGSGSTHMICCQLLVLMMQAWFSKKHPVPLAGSDNSMLQDRPHNMMADHNGTPPPPPGSCTLTSPVNHITDYSTPSFHPMSSTADAISTYDSTSIASSTYYSSNITSNHMTEPCASNLPYGLPTSHSDTQTGNNHLQFNRWLYRIPCQIISKLVHVMY